MLTLRVQSLTLMLHFWEILIYFNIIVYLNNYFYKFKWLYYENCANKDFSKMAILPPYNNLYAQIIQVGDANNTPILCA